MLGSSLKQVSRFLHYHAGMAMDPYTVGCSHHGQRTPMNLMGFGGSSTPRSLFVRLAWNANHTRIHADTIDIACLRSLNRWPVLGPDRDEVLPVSNNV